MDVDVKEGTVIDQKFPYSTNNVNQRFILSNSGIDLETLEVNVSPNYDENQFDVLITYRIVGVDIPASQLEFAFLQSR